jgi:hydroxymethylglutaryl-CoA lyase
VERLTIREVSPRDGLQNEKVAPLTTADKTRLIDGLVAAGVSSLEVTSFVKPEAVPMMADADLIMRYMRSTYPAVHSMGLVFNEQGFERALAADAKALALVFIVSDGLSNANTGKPSDFWLEKYRALIPKVRASGTWLRVYAAAAWVCPYDGQIPPERAFRYIAELMDLGVDELCLTDVIGHAHPLQVSAMFDTLATRYGNEKLAVHLHDTQALGLANAYAALQAGVRVFDTSAGGLGGCPFAPGSAGNLATEDFVLMAHKMGYDTGIDLDALWHTIHNFETVMGRALGGRSKEWYEQQLKVEG